MNYPIRKDTFLLHWLFWSGAVWVVSGLVMLPGAILMILALSFLAPSSFTTNLIATIYVGGIVGIVVGYTQHRLMQQFFFVNDRDWWRRSAFAGIPAAIFMVLVLEAVTTLLKHVACDEMNLCYRLHDNHFYMTALQLIPMTVFMGVLSLAQWSILRRYVDAAWLWIMANMIGGVIFGMIYASVGNTTVLQLGLGALAHGAVTGMVLLWLFVHKAQPLETPRRRTLSVWDEAI